MKLILCKDFIPLHNRDSVADLIEGSYDFDDFDGEPFHELKRKLYDIEKYDNETICISSDERLLMFYPKIFKLDDIYVYSNGCIDKLKDKTRKELRVAHNLFKMYVAGEFN